MRASLFVALALVGCSGTGEPAQPGPTKIVELDAGDFHTCVRLDDGTVECWGQCSLQCGVRLDGAAERLPVAGITDAVELAVGSGHSCARLADGDVACWGSNYNVGLGRLEPERSPMPLLVPDVHHAVEIAISGDLSCARLRDGTVMCWGTARGDYDRSPEAATARLARAVEGLEHAEALVLGDADACARTAEGWKCWRWDAIEPPYIRRMQPARPAPQLGDVLQATHGTCECRLGSDGVVHCTGTGILSAQLADGTSPPVQLHDCPADGLADVRTLVEGCAVMNDGTVRCWADPLVASPGTRSPVEIPGLTDVEAIAVGASHACVLSSAAELHCWGRNEHGAIDGKPAEGREWPPRRIDMQR